MGHKHILKLIGCCLETQIPILVFESFVNYETLSLNHHIGRHHDSHLKFLPWKQRLKISLEISNVFAYLHVGFPRPIVYSYMRSQHILLDEHYLPKLFDSSAECIPEGETQIKTQEASLFRATMGHMTPEYVKGGIDEKFDVYGFGALLFELFIECRNEYSERTEVKSSGGNLDQAWEAWARWPNFVTDRT
ncbi:hypothetical protein Dsin_000197 [Dipteronia sinensis]|uniref:Protein kinase domain-containing protein n=1 Tax=Dipteronia sinensis TaxID=43782 RepID=A0AAD9Z5I5_9ROSI|nr:hypothetical protein Dsin_000197 [Dipteronia sinensis]